MKRYVFFFIVAMSAVNLAAYAGTDDDGYIRMARISYMEGNVSFQPPSDVDWTAASINLPLQPGDRIYTGPQGRAEIQFDEGSVCRLAEGTDIQFLSLSEDLIQIRIMTGLSSLTISSDTAFEMDTPAAAFIVLRRGLYRFDTRDNGDTDAIVRKGELEAVSHRFVRRIESGERIFVTADENSSYNIARYSQRDAWDEWNDRRDADYIALNSRRHIPDTVYVGVSDLDRYGRWVTVESYGAAWIPHSIGVSWSPYSVGRWCYRPVWGWTWVSYEPWGWLPYHYGRWHHSPRFGWCWLPGPSFSFHFWSPGLVTFYYGPTWVSWCPLGPGDYYSINNYYYNRRLHGHHLASLRQLHGRNAGHSINRHVRGSFRTLEIEQFRNGGSRAVAKRDGYRQIDQPWNRGALVRERLAVKPTSRSFSPDPDRTAIRSRLTNPRPAVVHNTPRTEAAARNGYVRVTNPEVTSRAAARLNNGNISGSGNSGGKSGSEPVRVLRNTQSRSVDSAETRSAGGTITGNQPGRQTVNSNDRSDSAGIDNRAGTSGKGRETGSPARTYSQDASSGRRDRAATVRSAAPPDSAGTSSGANVDARRARGDGAASFPTADRIQSTPQTSGSAVRESVRTNRSSGQPGVSRNSSSPSRTRSYSAPSSGSRTPPSYSTPSSSSRTRTYTPPSTGSSGSYSQAPSSGSRTPSYSAPPSSNGRSRSYSAPSNGNSSHSYSAPSSGSRAHSYSAPSSGRSSSSRSSSSPSSGNGSDSGAGKARRR